MLKTLSTKSVNLKKGVVGVGGSREEHNDIRAGYDGRYELCEIEIDDNEVGDNEFGKKD